MMNYKYETCRQLKELSPNAYIACELFLNECKNQGLNVLITETYRSQERQNYIYEQGRTRPGQKITWTKKSNHTSRYAWDICKNVKGHEYDDNAFFKKCGEVAKKLGITWGGTWKTPDMPHMEISSNWTSPKTPVKRELTSPNDIVWELGQRGFVTDKQGMIDEMSKDLNGRLYWLARKVANMLRGV